MSASEIDAPTIQGPGPWARDRHHHSRHLGVRLVEGTQLPEVPSCWGPDRKPRVLEEIGIRNIVYDKNEEASS